MTPATSMFVTDVEDKIYWWLDRDVAHTFHQHKDFVINKTVSPLLL